MEKQPARESYFYKQGYLDLKKTIIESWNLNLNAAKEKTKTTGMPAYRKFINWIACLCIITFGMLITLVTTAAHITGLAVLLAIVYISFFTIYAIDRIYIWANGIGNACPNPTCQEKIDLPVYKCSSCGVEHTSLIPSKYGVLKRTCQCGEKIPTTFLNGRGSLSAECPSCHVSLSGNTGSRQYAIPVIGGPSVGKTSYISMALQKLMNDISKEKDWDIKFIDEKDKSNYEESIGLLNKGIRVHKTSLENLSAFQLELKIPNEKIARRINVYDISGEKFSTSNDIQSNRAYSYANGLIFVIDPLTLSEFEMEVLDKVKVDEYGASSKDFGDILNIMLINLEQIFGVVGTKKIKSNIAVVINKSDIPGLENKIGTPAVNKYKENNNETDSLKVMDVLCREFLMRYGAGNFVRTLDNKFTNVKYFSCSSLGHNENGTAFTSSGVEEPILWILNQIDKKL